MGAITGDIEIDAWLSAQIDSVEDEGASRKQRYLSAIAEHFVGMGKLLSPVTAGPSSDNLFDWDEERGLLQVIAASGSNSLDIDELLRGLSASVEKMLEPGTEESDAQALISSVAKQINGVEVLYAPMAFDDGPTQLSGTVAGFAARVEVWDLRRSAEAFGAARESESAQIERVFEMPDISLCDQEVKALGPFESEDCEVWIAVLTGDVLADIYHEHGPVLLELNVRSFLQTRGRVNKGIQDTIDDESDRFLAYNNGLSLTASAIELSDGRIVGIRGLQIVNGGQTTASLHHAKYIRKRSLAGVRVQAKITVVPDTVRDDLAPKVARFANAQNPVRMADFTSNNRFHIVLEELSKVITSPSGAHWYYERSTGRYADDLARAQAAGDVNSFRAKYPANRRLTKLDVAKIELAWAQKPQLAALGGQKASANYMQSLAEAQAGDPNERFYTDLVALTIVWKVIEGVAKEYGAYRAQVAAYTLALLSHLTAQRLDLDTVWKSQFVPDALANLIQSVVPLVRNSLVEGAGDGNITEWAKKPACWDAIREIKVKVPEDALRTRGTEGVPVKKGAVAGSTLPLSAEDAATIAAIAEYGAENWFALSAWAKDTNNLTPMQRKFAFDMGRRVGRGETSFSVKQGRFASSILSKATNLGFKP
ncbi:MAG: AIPR family protein [Cryobacterium sp.]|nr:AIPR family protein [Cryobacterium sp.]